MRRDHFTVTAENLSPETAVDPTLVVTYNGPAGTLTARLEADSGIPRGDDIDVTFRLLAPADEGDATGVLSLSRRLTGEYVLEANASAETVFALVDAARDDDGTAYRIYIERSGAEDVILEKETLLVYDEAGDLLRQHSLIPSGVEL